MSKAEPKKKRKRPAAAKRPGRAKPSRRMGKTAKLAVAPSTRLVPVTRPFGPAAGVFENLSPEDFHQIANELLLAEAERCGLRPDDLLVTDRTYEPDGGVDALVSRAPPRPSRFLPDSPAVIQLKRGALTPAKAKKEISKHPDVKAALQNGYAYLLVLGANVPPPKFAKLEAAVREAARKAKASPDAAMVLQAEWLASWCSEHLGVTAHPAFRRVGVPNLAQLQRIEEWTQRFARLPWQSDRTRDDLIARLRDRVGNTRQSTRVIGRPGAGKTRFVMEALQTPQLGHSVAFAPEYRDALVDVLRGGATARARAGILVVDECSDEQHDLLVTNRPPESQIVLVTIGAAEDLAPAEGADTFVIRPLPPEESLSLARATLQAANEDVARRISERSGGYPKLIDLLGEVVREMPEAAEWLTPSHHPKLIKALRSLLGRDNVDLAVRALTLVRQLGWEGTDSAEMKSLAAAFGLAPETMIRAVDALHKRGLIGRVSNFIYVTPEVLADWLAGDLWSDTVAGVDLFMRLRRAGMSGRALASVLRRLAGMGGVSATVPVVREILSNPELFESIDDLDDQVRAQFVSELATLDPKAAAELLRRLLRWQPRDRLLTFTTGRRQAVWALVKCAWAQESFPEAVETLLALADAENETWGNNATGVLMSLFRTLLGGTEATGQERVGLLKQLFEDDSPSKRILVVRAALSALELDSVGEVSPFPASVRGRSRWRPTTVDQEREYRSGAADLVVNALSDRDGSVRSTAEKGVVASVRSLYARRLGIVAERCVNALSEDKRMSPELYSAVAVVEKFDAGRMSPEERESLRRILTSLTPRTFEQRLRVALTRSPWGEEGEVPKDDLAQLAAEFLGGGTSPDREAWTILTSPDALRAYEFGIALGGHDVAQVLLEPLVTASLQARNYRALAGYLRGTAPRGQAPTSDEVLDRWADTRPELADAVFEATWLAVPSERGFRRLAKLIGRGVLAAERLGQLMYGGWLLQLPVQVAIEAVHLALGAPVAALGLVHQVLRGHADGKEEVQEGLADIALEAWLRCDAGVLADARGMLAWQWGEIGTGLARRFPSRVVERVLLLLEDRRLRSSNVGDSLKPILRVAADSQHREVWIAVSALIEKAMQSGRDDHIGDLLDGAIPVSEFGPDILEWVGDQVARARVAARFVGEPLGAPGDVSAALLDRFPGDEKLGAVMSSKFFSGSWVGPLVGLYESKLAALESFARSGRPGLARWAESLIPGCKQQIKWAKDQDERLLIDN